MNKPKMKLDIRRIIRTLMDVDLYKLTMMQAVLHLFPATEATYQFKCRNIPGFALGALKREVDEQLDDLCTLRFLPEELAYLRSLPYMKPDFIEFLEGFYLRRGHVQTVVTEDGGLGIIAHGSMLYAMMYEIYVMAIVQELYMERMGFSKEIAMTRLVEKTDYLKTTLGKAENGRRHPFELFEFGTRRRASRDWQENVVAFLKMEIPEYLRGTSNLDLARRYGLVPIGTMAHEWMQAHQAMSCQLVDFQKMALDNWVREYRGNLGIALTDTITYDAFQGDFDLFFAKLYDGQRHDSGDAYVWGEKFIAGYQKMKIDPNTKRMVFSNGLDFESAVALYLRFGDDAMQGYGIGTSLTNDGNVKPLNLVMKMVRCNGKPVAKISDEPGKSMCDDASFLSYLKNVFDVKD